MSVTSYKKIVIALAVLIAALSVLLAMSVANSRKRVAERKTTLYVPFDSVGRSTRIVGRLGKPFGDLMTVRGHWVHLRGSAVFPDESGDGSKGDDWAFEVFQVDGVKLGKPIVFNKYLIRYAGIYYGRAKRPMTIPNEIASSEGVWELRGFEDGECVGLPEDAEREALKSLTNEIPSQMNPGWPRDYGFYSRFCYVSATRRED
jgi:hypothetical protein